MLRYVEDSVYADLITQLNDDDYFVENVSAVYVSKEYLEELAYNSQSNIYFGYTLDELEEQFQGAKFVFDLGDNGQTVVHEFEEYDDTYGKVIKNVAIGTGVILICVTVSAVSAGVGAPAVSVIFAASAKTGTMFALSSGTISGVTAGIVKGIETKDFDQAIKAAALEGSNGFKWGAIGGLIAGGTGEAIKLYGAARNGLTMNEAAAIQKQSKILNEHVGLNVSDKIRKDISATYYEHIHQLFRLFALTDEQKNVMRLLAIAPVEGIDDKYFMQLSGVRNMNAINELDEIGLVYYGEHIIRVHPLVGEVAAADFVPDMDNCRVFTDNLILECRHHLPDEVNVMRQAVVLEICDRIVEFSAKSDTEYYFYFLINACPYAETFEDEHRMKSYISEMEKYFDSVSDKLSNVIGGKKYGKNLSVKISPGQHVYSREKLAELCDISDRCISNIERGVSDPKLSTALRLCEQCDIYTGSLSVLNADEDVHTDDSLLPNR